MHEQMELNTVSFMASKNVDEDNKSMVFIASGDLKSKLSNIFHSNNYQIAVVILACLDLLLVIGEILLDMDAKHQEAAKILHILSLVIIYAFLIESLVKIFVYQRYFWSRKGDVFDFIIVLFAVIVETSLIGFHNAFIGVGLIMVVRLWRILRIYHSYHLAIKNKEDDRKFDDFKQKIAEITSELQIARNLTETMKGKQKQLIDLLVSNNIVVPTSCLDT